MAPVRAVGHAVHASLALTTLGLLITSVIWDVTYLVSGDPLWGRIAFWVVAAGLVGALLTSASGLFARADGGESRRLRVWHVALGTGSLAFFALSLGLRLAADEGYARPTSPDLAWGWAGLALVVTASWAGGSLGDRLGQVARGARDALDSTSPTDIRHGRVEPGPS